MLETLGLSRSFGGVAAVAGVDFRLAEGELRCLIGPNGAGKSTFFRMLTGQLRPTAGRIVLMGHDMTGAHPFQVARLGVGIKTQVPSLFDQLSVRESLRLAAYRTLGAREAERAAEDMMDRMQLQGVADAAAGTLSHGQRQWIELGMVLVSDPSLVLLDEPAAGMTKDEVDRTVKLLGTLRGRKTIVVVEHDMQFIRRIAEKITVFHQGRILIEGPVEAVMGDAQVREVYLGKKAASHG